MDLLNNYIEMMGDTEFAIYVASFVFGLIFLIGVIAKLVQGGKAIPAPAKGSVLSEPAKPVEAKAAEAPATPVSTAFEGAMMWEGDDGKKKPKSVPKKIVVPPAPKKEEKPPLPSPVVPAGAPLAAEKTMILPPATEGNSVTPLPPELLPPAIEGNSVKPLPPKSLPPAKPDSAVLPPPPLVPEKAVPEEKVLVDIQMYETLVRRIAQMEADLKREPLYLDPLMKRIGTAEKRLEDIATKPAPKENEKSAPDNSEIKELKEKVQRIQKVLEQLSEGPSPELPAKGPSVP